MIEALYLHIPFCHAKCIYCDFYSKPCSASQLKRVSTRYVQDLIRRITGLGEAGLLCAVKTVYIGGGTPSVLGVGLAELVSAVRAWCEPVEITSEANPESFTPELACMLNEAGVTRISLGVQSLNDEELRSIGRLHTAQEALDALVCAKECGFFVSADLMCGLPGQTTQSWLKTLSQLLDVSVDHLSVYPLTIEEATPLARLIEKGKLAVPDEDFQAWCMEQARFKLEEAGLFPYEVASYAKEGASCQHNIAYWTGVPYLGLGPSAASMLDSKTYLQVFSALASTNVKAPLTDIKKTSARIRFVEALSIPAKDSLSMPVSFNPEGTEELTAREAAAEDLMLGMRMTRGLSEEVLERAAQVIPANALQRAIDMSCSAGLARWTVTDERRLVPTERGWLLGNELFELFWDLA